MKSRAIIQARLTSSRFRGKSLMPVAGKPLLVRVIERVQAMSFIDQIMIATSNNPADEPIEALAKSRDLLYYRGDENDVLQRFVLASSDMSEDDLIVRFTADNPVYDPARSELAYKAFIGENVEYLCLDGLSHVVPEFIKVAALHKCAQLTDDPFDHEHVTPFFRKQQPKFSIKILPSDFAGLKPAMDKYLTIDTGEELRRFDKMLMEIEGTETIPSLESCYHWLDKNVSQFHGYLNAKQNDIRIKMAGREIGDGLPTFIVAEIGQNHNGDMEAAKKLIEMAARCGADAVKFQKRDIHWELTDELYNKPYDSPHSFGRTYGEHREHLELNENQHHELKEYAAANGLVYFCTACDEPSVEMMERIGNPVYKIASRDISNIPLLKTIAQTRKPVIISTGMAGIAEIDEALEAFGDLPPVIVLLQCISQYPADLERINVRTIQSMRQKFGMLTGLSDHTVGIIPSVASVALGAAVVEKHITLSRAMKGTDQAGSLEEEGLRRLVKYIREVEIALGDGIKQYDPAADTARKKLARSLTSKRDLRKGEILTEELIVLKSPGDGIIWREREAVIGKRLVKDIAGNTTLRLEDFE